MLGQRILEALTTAYGCLLRRPSWCSRCRDVQSISVQGRMIFSSGFIHGDPHPGSWPQKKPEAAQHPQLLGTSSSWRVGEWLSSTVVRQVASMSNLLRKSSASRLQPSRLPNYTESRGSWLLRRKIDYRRNSFDLLRQSYTYLHTIDFSHPELVHIDMSIARPF